MTSFTNNYSKLYIKYKLHLYLNKKRSINYDSNNIPKINEIIYMSRNQQAKFADVIIINNSKNKEYCDKILNYIVAIPKNEFKNMIYSWTVTDFANLSYLSIYGYDKQFCKKIKQIYIKAFLIMIDKIKFDNKIKELKNKELFYSININKKK